jgi:hypothetical protein
VLGLRYALRILGCLAAIWLVVSPLAEPSGARQVTSSRPFQTSLWEGHGELGEVGAQRIAAAGARVGLMVLHWRVVAPATRPDGFRAADHEDPAYNWKPFDERIRRVARAGLAPLVTIFLGPSWTEGTGAHAGYPGSFRPNPDELGAFARAAATRYSGRFADLPRVRYWQAWSEHKRPVSPTWYRRMLNSFATAVHSVHRDNVVVTGGLAPFEAFRGDPLRWSVAPLEFMRQMLCMSKKLKPTCSARSQFDVWAHHPYTSGGPNHHAFHPDDVSIGDLPEMKRLLDAAVRAGHVESRRKVGFWVTEFGWDTKPPDPNGVPIQEHARWVSEALYRMWQSGVSLVTWLALRDMPPSQGVIQQGLYWSGPTIAEDRPKPALKAFRFPTVALPHRGRVVVWGRTPTSTRGRVVLELHRRGGWRRLAIVRANRNGIFQRTFKMRPGGYVRARAPSGELSLPFAVRKTRDRRVCPFGTFPNCPGPNSQ